MSGTTDNCFRFDSFVFDPEESFLTCDGEPALYHFPTLNPPSISSAVPVTNAASSLAR